MQEPRTNGNSGVCDINLLVIRIRMVFMHMDLDKIAQHMSVVKKEKSTWNEPWKMLRVICQKVREESMEVTEKEQRAG